MVVSSQSDENCNFCFVWWFHLCRLKLDQIPLNYHKEYTTLSYESIWNIKSQNICAIYCDWPQQQHKIRQNQQKCNIIISMIIRWKLFSYCCRFEFPRDSKIKWTNIWESETKRRNFFDVHLFVYVWLVSSGIQWASAPHPYKFNMLVLSLSLSAIQ